MNRVGEIVVLARVAIVVMLGFCFCSVQAEEAQSGSEFGSPDTVENLILEDAVREWKSRLQSELGIGLGFDYTTLAVGASESLGEDSAWGGIVRFYGAWELANRGGQNSGALVWKVERRHRVGDIPPQSLAGQLGYAGFIGPPFSNEKFRFTNLYWRNVDVVL